MSQVDYSTAGIIERLDDLEDDATAASNRLDDVELLVTGLVYASLSAGAEAANARAVTIQMKDFNGDNVSEVITLHCQLFDSSMVESLTADFRLAETGAGAPASTTSKPTVLITTSAAGAATLTVTDVQGASGATVYLIVTPVNKFGRPQYLSLTFDGV